MKIKYDNQLVRIISVFNSITDARLKDCFCEQDHIVFVVEENEIGKAVGKGGSRVKMLERTLNRKIKIVEFNPSVTEFVRNLVFPIKIKDIKENGQRIIIEAEDSISRGLLIGRAAQNLRNFETITKRYFSIEEIRVI
ncbi:MAG: NusA-like transcription termination signal-binding factor [Candidatus Woesearchaeota archaeon]